MTSLKNSIPAKLIFIKLTLAFIALSLPVSTMSFPGFPRKELPFCPGGGPPGWMNHFDYKQDQKIRQRYPHYQSPYLYPYHYRQLPHNSAYFKPYPYRPYPYASQPYASNYTYQLPKAFR